MDQAQVPGPAPLAKHQKPTQTREVTKPTQYTLDGKQVSDTTTETTSD